MTWNKRNSRLSKLVVALLIISLIFSFNSAFGITVPGHTCTNPYTVTPTIDDVVDLQDPDVTENNAPEPAEGQGDKFEGSGEQSVSGTTVKATIDGTEAHLQVISGAIEKVIVKAGHYYRTWTFSPAIQAGQCITVDSRGMENVNGGLLDISHINWWVGEITEKGAIKVIKSYNTEAYTGTGTLPDVTATFELYSDPAAEEDDLVQSEDLIGAGYVEFVDLALGTYWLKEVVPAGYVASPSGLQEVEVVAGSATEPVEVAFTNTYTEEKGAIKVIKSYDNSAYEGTAPDVTATFELYSDPAAEEDDLVQSEDLIGAGYVEFEDLALGTYWLKEVVPAGYVASPSGLQEIEVVAGSATEPVEVEFTNTYTEEKGAIKVIKSYDNSAYEGTAPDVTATFELYSDPAAEEDDLVQSEDLIGAGYVEFEDLALGTYWLKEVVPAGYVASPSGLQEIEVVAGSAAEPVEVEFTNTYTEEKGSIEIIKDWGERYSVASVPQPPLTEIATFQLSTYDDEDQKYEQYGDLIELTSGEPSATISNLPLGTTYYLKELKVKGQYGYVLTSLYINSNWAEANDDGYYAITLDENNEGYARIEANNDPAYGDIEIIKEYSGKVYPDDLLFHLYWWDEEEGYVDVGSMDEFAPNDSDDNISGVSPFCLGDDEYQIFTRLPVGTYYLSEDVPNRYRFSVVGQTKNSDGYYIIEVTERISSNLSFGIAQIPDYPYEIVTFTALNSYNPPPPPDEAAIEIIKEYAGDLDGDSPVAVFTLYDNDGNGYTEIDEALITGEGSEIFSGLELDTYYLKEASPQDYNLESIKIDGKKIDPNAEGYYQIDATNGGETVSVTALNAENPPKNPPPPPEEESIVIKEELPKTGGNTAAYLFSGSAIIALGALLRRFKR